MNKSLRLPLFLSGCILLSQAFSVPSPVQNAASAAWVSGFSLKLSPLYVIFAPLCGMADRITLLSMNQALVFLVYVIAGLLLFLGLRRGAVGFFIFFLFLVWGALVPRPMVKLVTRDPDVLLIDFHSHSEASHDGRPGFSAEDNMRWHHDQGYDASFITDHNNIDSSKKAKEISRTDWQKTGYRSLEGEEISLWKTHLVVLGVPERIDNRPYDTDSRKIRTFIRDTGWKSQPVIASLPEYWRYHWDVATSTGGRVADFVKWGISGFEIINSAPKALDFPPVYRRQIVELCRANNLFMTGISDTHGYGSATAVWNAMRLPGWRELDPDQLEHVVLRALKRKGFEAVEVLERLRYNPEKLPELLLSPLINAGLYWRSLQLAEAVSWIAWIWLFCFVPGWSKKLKKSFSKNRKTR